MIDALAHGLSNKAISSKLNIPIKTIERILNEVNKKFSNNSRSYSPRIRLLASLLFNDFIDYQTESEPRQVGDLNHNLRQTLILSCIGFSNKAIAKLFELSEKAIELRFSQLFDYFNVDTKNLSDRNPRVSLLISSYCRSNIKKNQLIRLYRETQLERLEDIFDNPSILLDSLESEHKFIG